jgi:cell division ATPase FtsA
MGLKDDITADIAEAFDTDLADAAPQITIRRESSVYDTATNKNVVTTTDYLTRGVVVSYDLSEITDESIQPNDIGVLILQKELEVTPSIEDLITVDSTDYRIVRVSRDPIKATWDLQCRK